MDFVFDVSLVARITVDAATESEARDKLADVLDGELHGVLLRHGAGPDDGANSVDVVVFINSVIGDPVTAEIAKDCNPIPQQQLVRN